MKHTGQREETWYFRTQCARLCACLPMSHALSLKALHWCLSYKGPFLAEKFEIGSFLILKKKKKRWIECYLNFIEGFRLSNCFTGFITCIWIEENLYSNALELFFFAGFEIHFDEHVLIKAETHGLREKSINISLRVKEFS